MKIVADTNVLISGSFWKGDSYRIITLAQQGRIDFFISQDIVDEFLVTIESNEFSKKIKTNNLAIQRDIQNLLSFSNLVEPNEKICFVKDDPDDNKILECAVTGKVDFIITKDNHLLKLKEFRGIKIMKPEEFLKMIK